MIGLARATVRTICPDAPTAPSKSIGITNHLSKPTALHWQSPKVSKLDQSVNCLFRVHNGERYLKGHGEARATLGGCDRRVLDRIRRRLMIVVSSQIGCALACKMCWLTANGLTGSYRVDLVGFLEQLAHMLQVADTQFGHLPVDERPTDVHVTFMAMGDALANPTFLYNYAQLYDSVQQVVSQMTGLPMRINVSSIFPTSTRVPSLTGASTGLTLLEIAQRRPMSFYLTTNSHLEETRRQMMPNCRPLSDLMSMLQNYEMVELGRGHHRPLTFHGTLIKGVNSDFSHARGISDMLRRYGIKAGYNLVAYNPPDSSTEGVSDEHAAEWHALANEHVLPSADGQGGTTGSHCGRVVPRIGHDVKASCGTFYTETF